MATVTSKGQITIPKAVRDALGLTTGDSVVFAVSGDQAVLAKTIDLLDLAGSIPVPNDVEGIPWEEIRRRSRVARSGR